MEERYTAWLTTDADILISRGPCLLHCVVVLPNSSGGGITVYEGQDADSGDKILRVQGSSDVSKQVSFNPPLPLQRGLYAGDISHLDEALFHYTVMPANYLFTV